MPGAGTTDGHIKLAAVSAADKQTPLFNKKIDWDGYVLDMNCIAHWIFKTFDILMDSDLLPIIGFIPEVIWHASIWTTLLERVFTIFLECFSFSTTLC